MKILIYDKLILREKYFGILFSYALKVNQSDPSNQSPYFLKQNFMKIRLPNIGENIYHNMYDRKG